MRVALVCDWFHPRIGGIELHLQDLACRLRAAGHDVVIITPTPGSPVFDGIRVVRVHGLRAPRFGFLVTAAGVRAVGDALAAERVDVAHCHVSIVSPAALGAAHRAQRMGIATVVTFHSIVPHTPLLAYGARTMLGTSGWCACFSAVSRRVAGEVKTVAGERGISILSNGVDADAWRTTRASRADGTVELISVMRLNLKKRPLALVAMMRAVVGSLPTKQRVRLRIAGDGPERRRLERAVARAGLCDHVELLGHRTRAELRELFAASDIFVLPTVRESFGLAALEARCAGLPVVAMRASGVSETIIHDREGLLAVSDCEFAAHVRTLMLDREQRDRIARNNRETLPANDWPRVIHAHVALYQEAIALREKVRAEKTE